MQRRHGLLLLPTLALALGQGTPKQDASPAPQNHDLWAKGAPGALGNEPKDRPRIRVYHASAAKRRPAIVVCPGGGYGHLALDHEGRQIARWLNSIGVTAIVLEYRHRGKGYGHPAPLQDVQRALRFCRARADAWSIDAKRLGVLGFSAGGHLASSVSVHHDAGDPAANDPIDRHGCRPDFAILCYPVIALGQPFTHKGSQRKLLGQKPSRALLRTMSTEQGVSAATPPTFLWHTHADRAVSAQNSLVYYQALAKHGVQAELHIFEKGRHGLGLARGHAAERWPELCRSWLRGLGVLKD